MNITLSIGSLLQFEHHCYINIEKGMVFANVAKIESELSCSLGRETVKLWLLLKDESDFSVGIFDITQADFHELAKHLPADRINDRLNLLSNTTEVPQKGAFAFTDQVKTKAVSLNDKTTSTGK